MFKEYLYEFIHVIGKTECTDTLDTVSSDVGVQKVVTYIRAIKEAGRKIFWIGNGGSAAIATHSAADYFRTGNIKTQCFSDVALLTCMSNDFGYSEVFSRPIELYASPGDLLFAISSSGQSENIINAVKSARKNGCTVVTLSGFAAENPLRKLGDVNFFVPCCEYGYVELTHGVFCHCFLDLYMKGNISS